MIHGNAAITIIKIIFFALIILVFTTQAHSSAFYVDPENGSMGGDGSVDNPWSTLQEVWEQKKIQTYYWKPPYKDSSTVLLEKNAGAPVKAGDTIYLLSGYHGELKVVGAINKQPITVRALKGHIPRLRRVFLRSASNWIFSGISVSPSYAKAYEKISMFRVEDHNWTGPSSHITLEDSEIFSVRDDTSLSWIESASSGIYTQGSYTLIENVKINKASMGIVLDRAMNSVIRHCTITQLSLDGIQIAGADNFKIEYNTIKNIYTVHKENHYDLVQAWAIDGKLTGGLIRGNILIISDDEKQPFLNSVQGIGLFDGWYDDVTIENNLVVTNTYHGISIYGGRNCKIINNTVTTIFDTIKPVSAPIRVYPRKDGSAGSGNIIKNNFTDMISIKNKGISGGAETGNNIVTFTNIDHFVDAEKYNFRLRSSSEAINAGSASYAPETDLTGAKRDKKPDIGAYEYRRLD